MQRNYGKNPIPSLKKRSRPLEFIELNYLDVKSCIFICAVIMILIASILSVAAYPNSNLPITV